jgi:hypothetical protein
MATSLRIIGVSLLSPSPVWESKGNKSDVLILRSRGAASRRRVQ